QGDVDHRSARQTGVDHRRIHRSSHAGDRRFRHVADDDLDPMRYTTVNRFAILFSFALAACTSDVAPNATVESATPDSITTGDDRLNDLTITVGYEDGDGDLGVGVAEVHDCRADALVTSVP